MELFTMLRDPRSKLKAIRTLGVLSAWEILIVMGQEQELAQARLYLYTCARDVLSSAMRLLTLTPLERM